MSRCIVIYILLGQRQPIFNLFFFMYTSFMNDTESRLEAIEIKLAHLEDFIARLQNETVSRNNQLDKLAAEHELMKKRLVQISRDSEEIPNTKPPHY